MRSPVEGGILQKEWGGRNISKDFEVISKAFCFYRKFFTGYRKIFQYIRSCQNLDTIKRGTYGTTYKNQFRISVSFHYRYSIYSPPDYSLPL
ncbi:hypothetical protein BN1002_00986 [Bacillus sp. B-jedd]|nr:hypothetical protein BN1002_00986 [Bacillus sp. B-jedd]